MASERTLIHNPKGNNRNLLLSRLLEDGRLIKLAVLKPGESSHVDVRKLLVEERPRSVTIELTRSDGTE